MRIESDHATPVSIRRSAAQREKHEGAFANALAAASEPGSPSQTGHAQGAASRPVHAQPDPIALIPIKTGSTNRRLSARGHKRVPRHNTVA